MIRSLLYVPANSEHFVAKAHECGADAIILDLEDSAPPADKVRAREMLERSVPSTGRNGAKVFVRINSAPDMWRADAEAACRAGAFGLYVPKVKNSDVLADLTKLLTEAESSTGRGETALVPLIEDAAAVLDARAIARAPRVFALALGGEDLAADMAADPSPEMLRFPKLLVHYAAKAEKKLSFGLLRSVADYSDHAAIEAAAREARAFGFDGASCVHPSVVPLLNAGFSPSAEEIAWAERVVSENAKATADGRGAFVLHGKMIDAPIIARARRILAGASCLPRAMPQPTTTSATGFHIAMVIEAEEAKQLATRRARRHARSVTRKT